MLACRRHFGHLPAKPQAVPTPKDACSSSAPPWGRSRELGNDIFRRLKIAGKETPIDSNQSDGRDGISLILILISWA